MSYEVPPVHIPSPIVAVANRVRGNPDDTDAAQELAKMVLEASDKAGGLPGAPPGPVTEENMHGGTRPDTRGPRPGGRHL